MKSLLSTKNRDDSERLFADDLDLAAAGDDAAVQRLVAEFQPNLLVFARRRGVADPEGLVNLTFSAGIGGLSTFRGRDRRAFRAYLYQILRRRIVDEYRRAASQPRIVAGLDGESIAGLVDEDASSFDDRVADRELVQEILDQLTEEQREILEMRVLTGLSIKETADMTGRSEVAVKSMQRRALLSLRSVVIAAAVLTLAVLGVRLLMNLGDQVVIVENGPAGGDVQSTDDGFGDRSGDGGGLSDAEGSVGVLEAEVPDPVAEADAAGQDGAGQPGDANATETSTAGTETAVAETAADADGATADGASSSVSGAVSEEPPAADDNAESGEQGLSADVGYAAPCSIVTDGSPAKGEVAFVTYHFTGPYDLFRGTSADVVGPKGTSALLNGKANPARVWDGTTLPFAVTGNMLTDDGFRVQTLLADGGVKTVCDINDEHYRSPCKVKTDGPPAVGETASVTYRRPGRFWTLTGQSTYVDGAGGTVAFKSGTKAVLNQDVVRNFEIDESMFVDDEFRVRTVFGDGKAGADCQIS